MWWRYGGGWEEREERWIKLFLPNASPPKNSAAFLPQFTLGWAPFFERKTKNEWIGLSSFSPRCENEKGKKRFFGRLLSDMPPLHRCVQNVELKIVEKWITWRKGGGRMWKKSCRAWYLVARAFEGKSNTCTLRSKDRYNIYALQGSWNLVAAPPPHLPECM